MGRRVVLSARGLLRLARNALQSAVFCGFSTTESHAYAAAPRSRRAAFLRLRPTAARGGPSRKDINMPKQKAAPRPLNMAEPPALATVAEACATLRISRATCCRWIASGRLDVVKIGRTVRIKTPSIAALAA